MNCATCGGKISDIADAVEIQDQESGANRFVHAECSDDPANLTPKQFQTWAAWTFRALTHEAYGQRWAMLGLVDALDETAPAIADAYRARQVRIAKWGTPSAALDITEPLLREAVDHALDGGMGAEDIIQIVYLRLGQWMEENEYPTSRWFLSKSLDALRCRIEATPDNFDVIQD